MEYPVSGAQTLVVTVFDQWREANLPDSDRDAAWEVFVSWLILKNDEATLDTIQDGIVDGGNDGGMDAVYTLLEGGIVALDAAVVEDAAAARELPEGRELTLHIIQAKNSPNIKQTTVTNLQSVLPSALDLSMSMDDLSLELNEDVVERIGIFRSAYRNLLTRRPRIRVRVTIACKGSVQKLNENIASRARRLESQILERLPSAIVSVEVIGAEELWEKFDSRAPETLELECEEVLTSGESYVALAKLTSYMRLITDDSKALRRHLFDANVRDYQGRVVVNREIRASLDHASGPEFWWLNNGVTLLCDEAHSVGKRFALRNIQIVNGLQTSHTLAEWYKAAVERDPDAVERDDRRLLVRVIVASDDEVRDKIIRATNRQTHVPDASLRATDEIQRQIEAYFRAKGLFYDRRKGYYRNQGKDPGKIISIPFLGQAMYSIAYGKPEVARGKPNSLLAEQSRYSQAFDPAADLQVFYWTAKVLRAVDAYLQSPTSQTRYPERRYLAPFTAFALVVAAVNKVPAHWQNVRHLALEDRVFTDDELENAASAVKMQLDQFTVLNSTTASDATKRQPFTQHLSRAILGYDGQPDGELPAMEVEPVPDTFSLDGDAAVHDDVQLDH